MPVGSLIKFPPRGGTEWVSINGGQTFIKISDLRFISIVPDVLEDKQVYGVVGFMTTMPGQPVPVKLCRTEEEALEFIRTALIQNGTVLDLE